MILTPSCPVEAICVPGNFCCLEPNGSFKQNSSPWSKHSHIRLAKIFCYMLTHTLINKHFPSSKVLSAHVRVKTHETEYTVEATLWSYAFRNLLLGPECRNSRLQGHRNLSSLSHCFSEHRLMWFNVILNSTQQWNWNNSGNTLWNKWLLIVLVHIKVVNITSHVLYLLKRISILKTDSTVVYPKCFTWD